MGLIPRFLPLGAPPIVDTQLMRRLAVDILWLLSRPEAGCKVEIGSLAVGCGLHLHAHLWPPQHLRSTVKPIENWAVRDTDYMM